MSWNNNNGQLPLNVNNQPIVVGKVQEGTIITGRVKTRRRKNYTEQTFELRGRSIIPNDQGAKVKKSINTIRGRASDRGQH